MTPEKTDAAAIMSIGKPRAYRANRRCRKSSAPHCCAPLWSDDHTYAAKKFSYVTYDKILNFQYCSPTWFCTYYKNWSDYENNISVTVDSETDDIPEDSIIAVETKREYGIAKIKMDGSVISSLENKMLNATTRRDTEMQIVCETDSVRFVANCVLSGLSWNDDMSDCDVDVIVEFVEYTM